MVGRINDSPNGVAGKPWRTESSFLFVFNVQQLLLFALQVIEDELAIDSLRQDTLVVEPKKRQPAQARGGEFVVSDAEAVPHARGRSIKVMHEDGAVALLLMDAHLLVRGLHAGQSPMAGLVELVNLMRFQVK